MLAVEEVLAAAIGVHQQLTALSWPCTLGLITMWSLPASSEVGRDNSSETKPTPLRYNSSKPTPRSLHRGAVYISIRVAGSHVSILLRASPYRLLHSDSGEREAIRALIDTIHSPPCFKLPNWHPRVKWKVKPGL